jgi:hypothetical protein
MMHNFWAAKDPDDGPASADHVMKNMSCLVAHCSSPFGAGPISLNEALVKKTTGKSQKFNPLL